MSHRSRKHKQRHPGQPPILRETSYVVSRERAAREQQDTAASGETTRYEHNWGPLREAIETRWPICDEAKPAIPETRTLTVPVYRRPDGVPTCQPHDGTDDVCQWLVMMSCCFKLRLMCTAIGDDIQLTGDDGEGWAIPHKNCPLWGESEDR